MRKASTTDTFPGLLGRGLIEAASPGRVAPPVGEPSPVYWAGASLKRRLPGVSEHDEEPSPVYWAGASLKRGSPRLRARGARLPSPVYWAGASLKRASSLPESGDLHGRTFPGLLGRGLIEASLDQLGAADSASRPSPVYWAGASLKWSGPDIADTFCWSKRRSAR